MSPFRSRATATALARARRKALRMSRVALSGLAVRRLVRGASRSAAASISASLVTGWKIAGWLVRSRYGFAQEGTEAMEIRSGINHEGRQATRSWRVGLRTDRFVFGVGACLQAMRRRTPTVEGSIACKQAPTPDKTEAGRDRSALSCPSCVSWLTRIGLGTSSGRNSETGKP